MKSVGGSSRCRYASICASDGVAPVGERVRDPRAHAARRDVDPLHRQDHVAELADADEDDLGGADLLADLRDALRVAGALDEHLVQPVAVHRARLIRPEHVERRLLADRRRDALGDAGQAPTSRTRYSSTTIFRFGFGAARAGRAPAAIITASAPSAASHGPRIMSRHFFPNWNVIELIRCSNPSRGPVWPVLVVQLHSSMSLLDRVVKEPSHQLR